MIEAKIIDKLFSLFFIEEFSCFKYIIYCFVAIANQRKEYAEMVLKHFNTDFLMKLIKIKDSSIILSCVHLILILSKLEGHGLDFNLLYAIVEIIHNNFGFSVTSYEENLNTLLYLTYIFKENWGKTIMMNGLQNQIVEMLNLNNTHIFMLALECVTVLISQGFFIDFDYKHFINIYNENVWEKIVIFVDYHQEYLTKFVKNGLFEIYIKSFSQFDYNEKNSFINCIITLIMKYCNSFISENAIKSKIITCILEFCDYDSFQFDFIYKIFLVIYKILTCDIDKIFLNDGINQFIEADGQEIFEKIPSTNELNEFKNQLFKIITIYD